jgi:hypothetical protein
VLGILKLYGASAATAARFAVRAWPVAFSLVAYAIIVTVASRITAPLGMAGGMLLGLVFAACFSSYIDLIAQAVKGARVRLPDFRRSFLARFWDVISVLFAFWVIDFVVRQVITPAAGDRAPVVAALVGLAMSVFFNPVPELLYLGQSRSFYLLADAARFISKFGLEWLFPNVLFAVALLAPLRLLHGPAGQVVLTISSLLAPNNDGMGLYAVFTRAAWWMQLPMLLFVHWLMIFRGLLFDGLNRGGARRHAVRGKWGR